MRSRRLALSLASAAVLLVSCPNRFDPVLSRQAADTSAPSIVLTTPMDGSTYQSTVTVAGTVSDGVTGRVGSLTLSVPVAEIDASLTVDGDGTFTHAFSTAGISRAVVMTLTATDWNGNAAELVVTLFNDAAGPGIAVVSPEVASIYLSTVEVQGRIQTMAELDSLAVSVAAIDVADYDSGLRVIDVSDPSAPSVVGNFGTGGSAMGVVVAGAYAYVADWNSGLRIVKLGGD